MAEPKNKYEELLSESIRDLHEGLLMGGVREMRARLSQAFNRHLNYLLENGIVRKDKTNN